MSPNSYSKEAIHFDVSKFDLSQVPVFKHIPHKCAQTLAARCIIKELAPNEILLRSGDKVRSLYIVACGSLSVYSERFKEHIVSLPKNSCIGEMSVLDEKAVASASIKNGDSRSIILEMPFHIVKDFILNDSHYAHMFYRGTSELLASRLRNTNAVLHSRLQTIKSMIDKILKHGSVKQDIDNSLESMDLLGVEMVSRLGEVAINLERFLDSSLEIDKSIVSKSKKIIEQVVFMEAQKIDKNIQEIAKTTEVLDKIREVIDGGTPLEIESFDNKK